MSAFDPQPNKLLRNFSYLIEGKLAGSAHPRFTTRDDAHLAQVMKELGLGAIVSLVERPLDGEVLARHGIESLHISIRDFHAPTLEQIDEFIRFARLNIEAGRPVLAHCHAGMGRTGTMLSCYLVADGADPRRAIIDVRKRRPGSIETYHQEDSIYAFYQAVQQERARREAEASSEASPPTAPPQE
jgi:atypical dual specificity phosphatase